MKTLVVIIIFYSLTLSNKAEPAFPTNVVDTNATAIVTNNPAAKLKGLQGPKPAPGGAKTKGRDTKRAGHRYGW